MANELARPLTDAEERRWQERLAALARELLRGVLFLLAVPGEADGGGEADCAARIRRLL